MQDVQLLRMQPRINIFLLIFLTLSLNQCVVQSLSLIILYTIDLILDDIDSFSFIQIVSLIRNDINNSPKCGQE